MKQITLVLIAGLFTLNSYAQEKKDLVVSMAAGWLTSPYYSNYKWGSFFAIDFDYHLAKRHILSANYNDGEHRYFDNLTNDPSYKRSDGTNAIGGYHTFSVLYKYMFLDKKTIAGSIGSGAGVMTHSRQYPYSTSSGTTDREAVWTDLVFPVRLELDVKIARSVKLGLIGGFYIAPDYPTLAYYVGPRLGYVLK